MGGGGEKKLFIRGSFLLRNGGKKNETHVQMRLIICKRLVYNCQR
jgi:hypothetical protein